MTSKADLPEPQETGFRCCVCGKSSKDKKSLSQHVNNHLKKYPCDECGSMFARRFDIKRHKLHVHS